MIDAIVNTLENRAVRSIALLLAAIIGVGGNWWIYKRKQRSKREKLRRALHAEISSMKPVVIAMDRQHDLKAMDPLDPRSFLVDSVYQSSSDDLGLLTKSEISAIVEFYSTATSIQRVVGDEFHVAYEQVSRRDLLIKLTVALSQLRQNGDFEPDVSLESEIKEELPDESQSSRFNLSSIPLLRRFE